MGQRVSLYQGLSLAENVEFYGGLYGLESAELAQRWDEVAARLDLKRAENAKVEALPAGIRQRAGLAQSPPSSLRLCSRWPCRPPISGFQ